MSTLKILGYGVLAIVAIYIVWAAFIPMMFGGAIVEKEVEREAIERSPQYVETKRTAINKLYVSYTESEGSSKEAIKTRICQIAGNLPSEDVPTNAKQLCN